MRNKAFVKSYKKIISSAYNFVGASTKFISRLIDIRDFFIFGGLSLIGYGLWQVLPWVSCVVCGLISMLLGLDWLTRRPNK